jgi:hypothetical protein
VAGVEVLLVAVRPDAGAGESRPEMGRVSVPAGDGVRSGGFGLGGSFLFSGGGEMGFSDERGFSKGRVGWGGWADAGSEASFRRFRGPSSSACSPPRSWRSAAGG